MDATFTYEVLRARFKWMRTLTYGVFFARVLDCSDGAVNQLAVCEALALRQNTNSSLAGADNRAWGFKDSQKLLRQRKAARSRNEHR